MRDACARAAARLGRACSATPRRSCRSSSGAACGPTWSPTRRPRTISSTAICPRAGRVERWQRARRPIRRSTRRSSPPRSSRSSRTCDAMLAFHAQGIPTFDYGNNIRQVAHDEGVADAFAFPGFVPAYIRPLFCEGKGPFRWVALSGDPEDIYKTDRKVQGALPRQRASAPLARHGARAHRVPGTAGAHLLARAWASGISPASRSTRW